VLGHGERRLGGVQMADIVQLAMKGLGILFDRSAVEPYLSAVRRQQAGEQPQQRGLAAAVRARDHERSPSFEGKVEMREHEAPAAHAREVPPFEHGPIPCSRTRGPYHTRCPGRMPQLSM